jgi:hypothetical protein
MRLPNAERAEVDFIKLTDYVLSASHPRGRNKARVFASALGIGPAEAHILRDWLLALAVNSDDAIQTGADSYGQRFEIRAEMYYIERSARVVSAWIVRTGEDFPRLVTAFVE